MREIKIRAISELTNDWIYSNGYYFDGINYWFIVPSDYPAIGFAEHHMVKGGTIGQFTGLVDNLGKEIYEDDIVNFHYQVPPEGEVRSTCLEVVFHNGAFVQEHCNKLDPEYYQETKDIWYEWDEVVIVGTKYENPGLLINKKGE